MEASTVGERCGTAIFSLLHIIPCIFQNYLCAKNDVCVQDLCIKACLSLQCSKVCILLLEKDRNWLVQVACVVQHKLQASAMAPNQGDATGVYEGYKHNGIAHAAISSGECVVVASVKAHSGYDSRLDTLAGVQGRNCLAAPVMAGESKASARCVGVLFATNKQGGFLGDASLVSRCCFVAAAPSAACIAVMLRIFTRAIASRDPFIRSRRGHCERFR
jgi:hypothetical protein